MREVEETCMVKLQEWERGGERKSEGRESGRINEKVGMFFYYIFLLFNSKL